MRKEPLMDFTYQTGSDGMLYPQIQISEDMETIQMPVKKFGGMWKGVGLKQLTFLSPCFFTGNILSILYPPIYHLWHRFFTRGGR